MKTSIFFLSTLSMLFFVLFASAQTTVLSPKAIDTVVFTMELHGAHCENIIHKRMPFEKGVVKVKADASTQTVQVSYRSNKTDVKTLIKNFKEIGFDAKQILSKKSLEKQ